MPWLLVAVGGVIILSAGIWLGMSRRSASRPPAASEAGPIPAADDGASTWYARAAGEPNRLASASTPYLANASAQPVNWFEWGPEAFQIARDLDRPVFLDVGADWCVACDLMDHESYANPDLAQLINDHFVAIRVDRDARPDIDYRFQLVAQALSGAGGWPLTLFLTPEGKAFAGGTYYPPESRQDEVGLSELVGQVTSAYYQQRPDIVARAQQALVAAIAAEEADVVPGAVTPALEEIVGTSLRTTHDSLNGGWGAGAKSASGPAIAYMLAWHQATGDEKALQIATLTLDAISSGSLRDYVMGGLFRFTEDAQWRQPHFEKLAYVNGEALSNLARAYEMTGSPLYQDTAEELVDYEQTRGSDQLSGGFYASQASHAGTGVGSYYTWTLEEARSALSAAESAVVIPHLGISDPPSRSLPEMANRNVLYLAKTASALSSELGQPESEVEALIDTGKHRMAEARDREPAPRVDRTLYVGANALMISGYLDAARAFGRPALQDFATKTADLLLDKLYEPGKGIAHGYAGTTVLGVRLLEDQVYMAQALLDLHEATGDARYLDTAKDLFDTAVTEYGDVEGGGFYDIAAEARSEGLLQPSVKPIVDNPTPGANAVAALVATRLAQATGDEAYRALAERTLAAFAGSVGALGPMGATYGLALMAYGPAPAAAPPASDAPPVPTP